MKMFCKKFVNFLGKKSENCVNFFGKNSANFVNFLRFFSKKVLKFKKTLHACHSERSEESTNLWQNALKLWILRLLRRLRMTNQRFFVKEPLKFTNSAKNVNFLVQNLNFLNINSPQTPQNSAKRTQK